MIKKQKKKADSKKLFCSGFRKILGQHCVYIMSRHESPPLNFEFETKRVHCEWQIYKNVYSFSKTRLFVFSHFKGIFSSSNISLVLTAGENHVNHSISLSGRVVTNISCTTFTNGPSYIFDDEFGLIVLVFFISVSTFSNSHRKKSQNEMNRYK